MKIAVIGSRETADTYNRLLFGLVSVWLLEHEVRSGLCKRGPDSVVTRLCDILHREHLAGRGPKPNILLYPPKPQPWILPEYQHMAPSDTYDLRKGIVDKLHPNPGALDDYMYRLHTRNLNIVNGVDLDDPVDIVVYAHMDKKVKGGTKLGVDYAGSLGIPIFNVVHQPLKDLFELLEKIH